MGGLWYKEDISHSIPDHILTALIFVGLNGYFCLSFPRNSIKLGRACKLGAYLLCISLILEGMRLEMTIMYGSSPALELFIVMILWDNQIIILFRLSEAIHFGIWVCS